MKRTRHRPSENGSSLIIVLAFVLLLALSAVVFLSRTQSSFPISSSSANGSGADLFSKGALDQIVGDLKEEIVAGSQVITVNGTPIYLPYNPKTEQRQNILPSSNIPAGDTGASLTLVKESKSGQPFYQSNGGSSSFTGTGPERAANSPTNTASLNGRLVTAARWNAPLLMAPNSTTDYTPQDSNFVVPDWIYVARNSTSDPTTNPTTYNSSLSNSSPTNKSYVVGRYAYIIYDESALLDVNVAGSPSGTTPTQTNAKGSIGLADLTQLGLPQKAVDQIVGWRNYASAEPTGSFPNYSFSATSATQYFNYLTGMTGAPASLVVPKISSGSGSTAWEGARKTGFLNAGNLTLNNGQTDHRIESRQQLIDMLLNDVVSSGNASTSQVLAALPYLGTFSLALNSPSWMPVTPAPPNVPTKSTLDYSGQAYNWAANPSGNAPANQIMPAVLVTKRFTRYDGTTAQIGDPLMKYRFPLRWLEWFNTANQAANANNIATYFCMAKSTNAAAGCLGTWNYVDPDTHKIFFDNNVAAANSIPQYPIIKTLDQVAAMGREPTFWEVLQAAILSGSLGSSSFLGSGDYMPFDTAPDSYPVKQLLKIGLNIIDQYNSNPTPTVMVLDGILGQTDATTTVYITSDIPIAGTKNLPYFYGVLPQIFRVPGKGPGNSVLYDGFMQFVLWNPHYNSAQAPTNNIRLSCRAQGMMTAQAYPVGSTPPPQGKATANFQEFSIGSFTVNNTTWDQSSGVVTFNIVIPSKVTNSNSIAFQAGPGSFATPGLLTPSIVGGNAVQAYCAYPPSSSQTSGSAAKQVGFYFGQFGFAVGQLYPPGSAIGGGGTGQPALATAEITSADPPQVTLIDKTGKPTGTPETIYFAHQDLKYADPALPSTAITTYYLYTEDSQGNWIPYEMLPSWDVTAAYTDVGAGPPFTSVGNFMAGTSPTPQFELACIIPDPRTLRFGAPGITYSAAPSNVQNNWPTLNWSIDPNGNAFQMDAIYASFPNFSPSGSPITPGNWCYNTTAQGAVYPAYNPDTAQQGKLGAVTSQSASTDDVMRQGDANVNIANAAQSDPNYNSAANAAVPYFLGRSFNSVAEMGYASRDEPWKTLNFFTSDSADGALLDFFSLSESDAYAGGININTASAPVLAAMLSGAEADAADTASASPNPASALNATQINSIAQAIRTYLGSTRAALGTSAPTVFDPSDLAALNQNVMKSAPISPSANLGAVPFGEKREQEVIARSVADSWNTRTWNLMIDIIAQTGRFPANATNGSMTNFIVTGERRIWAHVAIDRFTGKVLALRMEPAME